MGYDTSFDGVFKLDKPLTPEHRAYLEAFAGTRRMQRNADKTATMPDSVREAVGLPVGDEGCYYVGMHDDGGFGQTTTPDITDYNKEPKGQPGLWCKWIPCPADEPVHGIVWSGAEKFYYYTEWLVYLNEHFLRPWGYVLNGEVEWSGEEHGDVGKIYVKDNAVKAVPGHVVNDGPSWREGRECGTAQAARR